MQKKENSKNDTFVPHIFVPICLARQENRSHFL